MTNKFYIFGSENSQDYDVLIEVDEIPNEIHLAHELCRILGKNASEILNDKPVNPNLIVIKNQEIIKVFKGTIDEVNNALFYTYSLHNQLFELPILKSIERHKNTKLNRVIRTILSIYARTDKRKEFLKALNGSFEEKIEILKTIDFKRDINFGEKSSKNIDIYKSVAFQFAQYFSLLEGFENQSYTKNLLAKNYSDLKPFLERNENEYNLEILNLYLKKLLNVLE